jgi:hypothetical protein
MLNGILFYLAETIQNCRREYTKTSSSKVGKKMLAAGMAGISLNSEL